MTRILTATSLALILGAATVGLAACDSGEQATADMGATQTTPTQNSAAADSSTGQTGQSADTTAASTSAPTDAPTDTTPTQPDSGMGNGQATGG